ncbi:MAG: LPS assembly protein LptD, partial [Paracoccaceae bacterium]
LKLLARAALGVALGFAAEAQDARTAPDPASPVALVADEITFDEQTGVLTARGDVELYQQGKTLTAAAIRYDSRSERIAAEGPITLRTERGETVYADGADLDASLRDGLVQGARSVIAGGGKIAAAEAERIEGRYNVMGKAVFSPCEVCAAHPVPLWRIRAERIVHDQQERVIHYENAWFDVLGAPVAYLPYFQHPSPEVKRASGLLAPEFGTDRAYGVGVKIPYIVVLDDHSDLTLTPFITTEDGAILEVDYRRRFERGYVDLDLSFGVTDYDDAGGAEARLGAFGSGRYLVSEGVHAGFDLAFAADDAYLRRYDYTDLDRLRSEAFVRAYDGPNRASVDVAYLQSLRDNDPQGQIPMVLPEISLRRVWATPGVGGELGVELDSVILVREDDRDVGRLSLGADWSRQHTTSSGVILRGFTDAQADLYQINDDPAFDSRAARFVPRIGAEARMPFSRVDGAGRTHVVEPIIQFSVAPDVRDGDIPNEDSVVIEFDEMNLFETNRSPGFDRVETGANITVGANYEMIN